MGPVERRGWKDGGEGRGGEGGVDEGRLYSGENGCNGILRLMLWPLASVTSGHLALALTPQNLGGDRDN